MGESLADLCRSALENNGFEEIKSKGLVSFLLNQPIEEETVNQLIDKYLALPIDSYQDYLFFLKKSLNLLIAISSQPFFYQLTAWEKVLKRAESYEIYHSFYLPQALRFLIAYYLKKNSFFPEVILNKKESFFQATHSYFRWSHLISLANNAETVALWALIAHLTHSPSLAETAKKSSYWFLNVLDKDFYPFHRMWNKEKEGDLLSLFCSIYVMFYSVGAFIDPTALAFAKKVLKNIETHLQEKKTAVSSFYVFLSQQIDTLCEKREFSESLSFSESVFFDPEASLISLKNKQMDCAFSLYGINSSCGAIHCKDVRVVSFGPQFFPLTDMRSFGICRLGTREKNDGFTVTSSEKEISFEGWTRLNRFSSQEKDDLIVELSPFWQHLEGKYVQQKLYLTLNFFHQEIKEKLFLSLFVQARTCHFNEKELLPRQQEICSGEAGRISLRGKEASLSIKSEFVERMHVIPLNESDMAWHANFLIAYEIDPNKKKCLIEFEKK